MSRLISIVCGLIISLNASGQIREVPFKTRPVRDFFRSLKNAVDTTWIRENPVLSGTKPSFFNRDNQENYFVGLLEISGQSFPISQDHTFSLLQFLLALDSGVRITQGTGADEVLKGTKLTWNNKMRGLLWFNNAIHEAEVDSWHLFEMTECPGTIIFPFLTFTNVKNVANALTNTIQGLTILPYDRRITKITISETRIATNDGKTIEGTGYDINNDDIFDIFTYGETIDDTTMYQRLYINISGHLECRWIRLDEVCV